MNHELSTGEPESTLEGEDILRILPHRPPFLLLDRVVRLRPGELVEAIKNVSFGDWSLQGHFPHRPVMPGVMVLEAMAQASAVLVHATEAFDAELQNLALLGVDGARFRRPIRPGDQLRLRCTVAARHGSTWRFRCQAAVDDELAAEAAILAAVGQDQDHGRR
jgi:3-hydroxyacyl-[acyl-carrier-protein] dehydratase